MFEAFKRFFLVTEESLNTASLPMVRQSALRIILSMGMLLVLGIFTHSSVLAVELNLLHAVFITAAFCGLTSVALLLSLRYQIISSAMLLVIVFAAGIAIIIFVQHPSLAKLGIIFFYTAPLISLLFFPPWVTFSLVLVNLLPFAFLFNRSAFDFIPVFFTDLPHTHEYLHSLLFLFFNICIPLAMLRVLATLRRNAAALKQLNTQLSRSHQLYEEMFENTQMATLLVNQEGEVLKLNSKASRLLGVEQTAAVRLASLLVPAGEVAEASVELWQTQPVECQCTQRPGGIVLLSQIGLTERDHIILQLEDLSELRVLHQRLEHREHEHKILQAYDVLTQLPNALLFSRMLQKRLKQTEPGVMLIIRLCNVKSFNQQHGYNAGDELLKQFAQRSREIFTNTVLLGRLRGVKFIAWSPVPGQAESPRTFAAALLAQLPEQLVVGQQLATLSYELGATITSDAVTGIEDYIEQCESALEFAEHYRQPIAFYTAAAVAEREAESQLLADLKQALQRQQLRLWLQPKTSALGNVESFEALLRWERTPAQFIAPDKIVMLAEKYGLLVPLSRFVLNQAVLLLKRWHQHKAPFSLSINLAGPDIMDPVFFSELVSLATHQPWLVDQLEIELTETSIISQQQRMFEKLSVLKKLGFQIAIDDFGTGQASLSLLAKLPASTLKLDRSFLSGFPHDRLQLKVLQATIQLAKSLNLKLIVEGVETEVQRKFLLRLGCEYMQGYLFAKPAPIEYWHEHRIFLPYFRTKAPDNSEDKPLVKPRQTLPDLA